MKIKDSLVANDSIQLNKSVKNWEEAIHLLMKPLLDKKVITKDYPEAIIKRTKEIGPFYVLAPGMAMPHERSECGALKDAFTFLTLDKQVEFPNGEMVDILIGFSAINPEVHVAEAIPQIMQLLDDDESFDLIRSFRNKDELIDYIEKTIK